MNDKAAQTTTPPQAATQALPQGISAEARAALARVGIKPEQISVPDVPIYSPMLLEEVCGIPSRYKDALGESPLMYVTQVQLFPEAEDFVGYIGFFRVECVMETGDLVSWSSHMINKETGEAGPLYAWVHDAKVPFAMKVVHVKTRTPGRTLYRPLPVAL